ncbi:MULTISPECIES: PH domain-containing protein [Bacillaceae]|uniref:PH domain-containing protein n=1 Tax=Bacillaceae TaxID=186817 RepID=UPI001E54638C|nr:MULTISPECIES: PH domain-containing protein [Bacillaceae]MCE4051777.1 PH domain-containing protein [Bacillus sp. Au-Bac7]MCM3034173.1 PH domain-containing protein [Niallia sp. MER 6]MDL0437163.1 PH domain-containing protein [Niallia sp. SS-2023]UPO87818.1 PH domain-containing protein [Niallia sp. Man26]
MYTKIEEPNRCISEKAMKVWRISEALLNGGILVVLGIVYYLDVYFDWKYWIGWIIIGLLGLTVLSAIWGIILEPSLKQKYWRYDVDEEFIQLKSGIWNKQHQLIPMTKVQSVELIQGPLLRKYELYSISVGTMGSSHKIPAIPQEEARELRDQIAHYAKIKEVE